ncbi:hypothetical protein NTD86_21755 [Pseudomonas sp. 7P_10.2_Bac1]|uniref:hypothetical protein n=1 Tax=Pseudomonas sp. 7P_10.2_Bac1 TaxID=2971614 RepID=UPI0021C5EDEB|nr:hypothetical protein [Pseudomonas sp. 7P_10.2_Bac1]MCU1729606.1 hypothetical protein [Pseudomonas sp. 7P_10.2_Bac1]
MVTRRQLLKFSAIGFASLTVPIAYSEASDNEIGMNTQLRIDSLLELKKQNYKKKSLFVEDFGLVDTPKNTKMTMQKAINYCAAKRVVLRNKSMIYTIDTSDCGIEIPNNFMCDFGGAWIKRAIGNKTPHDMWANSDQVNGNAGIIICGVKFDGQAAKDELSNKYPEHRFCGLRLIKCEGQLISVQVDDTCNGEIQAEGTRGGIVLENSVFMDCYELQADNNIGTGLFIVGGKGKLTNFKSNNNAGSGLSGIQPGWVFESLSSIGSGYSGISLNGAGWVANDVYGAKAAVGYAGVNFGHALPITSNAVGGVASNVVAENNEGWGINVTSSPGIQGANWLARNSGDNNIRLIMSPGAKITLKSENAGANGLLIIGAGHYEISANISGSKASGIYGRNGADIAISPDSIIDRNGTNGGLVAEITLDTKSKASVAGKVINGMAYGVQSTDSSVVIISGGVVENNALGNMRETTGGVVRYEGSRK